MPVHVHVHVQVHVCGLQVCIYLILKEVLPRAVTHRSARWEGESLLPAMKSTQWSFRLEAALGNEPLQVYKMGSIQRFEEGVCFLHHLGEKWAHFTPSTSCLPLEGTLRRNRRPCESCHSALHARQRTSNPCRKPCLRLFNEVFPW